MADNNPEIILSAVNTTACFLSGIPEETIVTNYMYTAAPMLNVFTLILKDTQPDT